MAKFYEICNKIYFWILVGLLMFVPLYPKFPLLNVSTTYVAVRVEDVVIAVVVIIWGLLHLKDFPRLLKQPIFQSFVLFWIVGALSILSAILLFHTVKPSLAFLELFRRVEYMILFFVGATTIRTVKQIKIILVAMLLTTVLVVFYGLGQQWLGFPVISTTNQEYSKGQILHLTNGARPNSTFAGYYDLAIFLTLVITFLSAMFFYYRNLLNKFIIAGVGVISFLMLGLTAARTSFAATLVGLSTVFWIFGKRKLIIGLAVVSIITIAAVPQLRNRLIDTVKVNVLHQVGPTYQVNQNQPLDTTHISQSSRSAFLAQSLGQATLSASEISKIPQDVAPGEPLNQTELEVYRSAGIRFNVEWPRAIQSFEKDPLLGTGYSSISLATDNDYLRSLGEMGILGTLAFALIIYIVMKRQMYVFKHSTGFVKYTTIAMFSSLVALLVTATVIDAFEASKVAEVFWLVLGACWALMTEFEDAK